jgi:hypothetical protein
MMRIVSEYTIDGWKILMLGNIDGWKILSHDKYWVPTWWKSSVFHN